MSLSWKHRSRWGRPIKEKDLLSEESLFLYINPALSEVESNDPAVSLYHKLAVRKDFLADSP